MLVMVSDSHNLNEFRCIGQVRVRMVSAEIGKNVASHYLLGFDSELMDENLFCVRT